MKRFAVGLLALAIPFAAYAAKNSQTVNFAQSAQVGSTTLPAGPAKVSWTGTGSDATLTVVAHGTKPVTVPVEVVPGKNAYSAISTIKVNGVDYLQNIELGDVTLVVKNAPTVTGQNGN